eukprot:6201598-Pleurochrysis_carterae.AAC.3
MFTVPFVQYSTHSYIQHDVIRNGMVKNCCEPSAALSARIWRIRTTLSTTRSNLHAPSIALLCGTGRRVIVIKSSPYDTINGELL